MSRSEDAHPPQKSDLMYHLTLRRMKKQPMVRLQRNVDVAAPRVQPKRTATKPNRKNQTVARDVVGHRKRRTIPPKTKPKRTKRTKTMKKKITNPTLMNRVASNNNSD